jgi:hypothetical protein
MMSRAPARSCWTARSSFLRANPLAPYAMKTTSRDMDRIERLKVTQQRRAEQFAACAYVLEQDPSIPGAEALFDRGRANGLVLQ